MAETENKIAPTLRLYADFPAEWEVFDDDMRRALSEFLEHLQVNPYDGRIMETSEKHGEYYASHVGPLVVYWKLDRKGGVSKDLNTPPDAIHVLAVQPADRLR